MRSSATATRMKIVAAGGVSILRCERIGPSRTASEDAPLLALMIPVCSDMFQRVLNCSNVHFIVLNNYFNDSHL